LESTALVGQPLQVEARLADLSQQPISGAEVTFTVAGAHSQTATTLTNPSGVASWSYAGLGQGMDQIIASAGGQATTPANVTWVDPQSIGIVGLTATPLVDVSGWKPLNLSASSPGAGSWSIRILSPGGEDVTSAGSLSITSPNPGTSFAANWIPSSYYALTGAHQAVVQLTDGTSTVTAAITFAVYNFTVRIRSVTFTDASFNPIAAPRAGQNFFIKVEIQNVGPSALSMVFVPVMVGSQYIGGGAMGNVLPGQVASPFIAANIAAAGSYTVRAYSWTGPGGAALAQPLILSITVLP
ncbi:MAG: Ig-like domain-containing protein, partial [Coprothermobacterota bacterium]|nr:Ig-like domain-containing protein [Coprothermobacterota bacterium]